MSTPLSRKEVRARLVACSVRIRRATARAQIRDWEDGGADHVLIARLDLIADELSGAARVYGPVASTRRAKVSRSVTIGAWAAAGAAVLWVAGPPGDPVTLALFVAGTGAFGLLFNYALWAVRGLGTVRALAEESVPMTEDVLADLRTELDDLEERLPADRADLVLRALEGAELWRGAALEHLRFGMPPGQV
ncbi:hypothetical protein AB0M43_01380 [Longispora sp. NPDC051575]|uniref:hypothetical protein n=1 Tax=Longispora sp. NPDC051575 TaxID=3154943 RepID=UPI003438205A